MKYVRVGALLVFVCFALILAACSPASAFSDATSGMETGSQATETRTPVPAVTETPLRTLQPTETGNPTTTAFEMDPPISHTATPIPSPDASLKLETLCHKDVCIYQSALPLERPIAPPGRVTVDGSYRFGSTQDGARDPHHGVEFLNSLGTPVLASADGRVVFAGDDNRTLLGPYYGFYGNLVVLAHNLPGLDEPLYSLYAHLSQVLVQAGDRVESGQEIGRVGLSGVATGSHLHFEVRLGTNDYRSVRNPELWLKPLAGQDGLPGGAIAVRVLAPPGVVFKISNIVIERLSEQDGVSLERFYLNGYQERALVGNPPWEESFGLGDLIPGWYRVSFVQYGMQSRQVQVQSGALTLLTFDLSSGE